VADDLSWHAVMLVAMVDSVCLGRVSHPERKLHKPLNKLTMPLRGLTAPSVPATLEQVWRGRARFF
jgi:hypothetical protein